ncbi:MAG: hypothetical protein MUF54_00380 [Polyangiaceae bacterium]|jgi:hypothetical protein|nr:hypothetical protein [Polyangiaceae bacterium]
MSDRTTRTWQHGSLPSQSKQGRTWRTREGPLAEVWESEVAPLLRQDEQSQLQATTILQALEHKHPGQYGPSALRTLQRRMGDWRSLYGAGK